MKVYDNKLKYVELLMKYDDLSNYKKYELPEGFHYEFYKPGDEEDWVNIHIESGEFTSIEKGLKYFHDFYDSFIEGAKEGISIAISIFPSILAIIFSTRIFISYFSARWRSFIKKCLFCS